MKIRDYTYYRAVYCGVCHAMADVITPVFSLALRYDFVFLTLVRLCISGETGTLQQRRCAAHPIRRRSVLTEIDADTSALSYTARCGALLSYYKAADDCADEHGMKLLRSRCTMPFAKHMRNRAMRDTALGPLGEEIVGNLGMLAACEQRKETSPDAAAQPFADLLAAIFSYGLKNDRHRRIAAACGQHVGRFIYLCDAADDAADDEKNGAYNPFVLQAQAVSIPVQSYLQQDAVKTRLYNTLLLAAGNILHALDLSDRAGQHPAWPCIENICTFGLPAVAAQITEHPGKGFPRQDFGKDAVPIDQTASPMQTTSSMSEKIKE